MQSLKEAVRQFIRKMQSGLAESASDSAQEAARNSDAQQALKMIGEADKITAVPEILSFTLADDHGLSAAAAEKVHALTGRLTTGELAQLSELMRELSPYLGQRRAPWFLMKPEQVIRLKRFAEHSVALSGLASFHRSGYVREAALKLLSQNRDGTELPFLLLRINDWVAVVRETAEKAVRERLTPDYALHFLNCLPLVVRLRHARRSDHTQLVDEILTLLKSDECQQTLLSGLDHCDKFVRRLSFQTAMESPLPDRCALVERTLRDQDTWLRLKAAEQVATICSGEKLEELMKRMKQDRFSLVRRAAWLVRLRRRPPATADELHDALLDRHLTVRREAAWYLRRTSATDVAGFYRSILAEPQGSDLFAALCGLGENGSRNDSAMLLPYLAHAKPKVRRAALKALAAIAGDDYIDVLLAALEDQALSVACEAARTLRGRAHLISRARLWQAFENASDERIRLKLLRFFGESASWENLSCLLRAIAFDGAVAREAGKHLNNWIRNHNFSKLTSAESQSLKQLLAEQSQRLNPRTLQELEFILRTSV
jgi:HEAT repeat protein